MEISEYLNQTEEWIGREGVIPIRDMSIDWRVKAAKWLMRHARVLHVMACASLNEAANDHTDSADIAAVIALVTQNPNAWVRKSPLYMALCEGINLSAYVLVDKGIE